MLTTSINVENITSFCTDHSGQRRAKEAREPRYFLKTTLSSEVFATGSPAVFAAMQGFPLGIETPPFVAYHALFLLWQSMKQLRWFCHDHNAFYPRMR